MKNKKKLPLKILILTLLIVVFIIFIAYVLYSSSKNEILGEFNKEGYDSTNKDLFYKKITTDNTLEDFYNDMSNNTDTAYQEFYFSKDSTEFIELKMLYKSGVSTSLNITSDLKNNDTKFNYELSYKEMYLILEGNDKNDYDCNIVKNNNISQEIVKKYCDMIIDEIDNFETEKAELLKNEKIKALIK